MSRHPDDKFPTQTRYRGVDPIDHDPLEIAIAQRQAKEQQARDAINAGRPPDANPAEHRGIPLIARGIGGTQPGTNPLNETIRRMSIR